MKNVIGRFVAILTALAWIVPWVDPFPAFADALDTASVTIKVRVTERGFLDEQGKPYGPKRVLNIPKDRSVTITFVFWEDLTSLAVGDTHRMAIQSEDGGK
jgi:hypothetical protein